MRSGREAIRDLAAQVDDLGDPAASRLLGRKILEQEQVLDNVASPAAHGVAQVLPQVGDLLGDVGQIQRQVRPATCEAPQFSGLKLRPGDEIVLV
jgi:hypothetical protein